MRDTLGGVIPALQLPRFECRLFLRRRTLQRERTALEAYFKYTFISHGLPISIGAFLYKQPFSLSKTHHSIFPLYMLAALTFPSILLRHT